VGYVGSQGYTGSSGAFAAVGFTGSIGFTGSSGEYAAVGFTGSRGATGVGGLGYTGSSGAFAAIGFTGSAGSGYTGSSGAFAAVGFTGSIGYTGSSGAFAGVGFTGSHGYTGSSGAFAAVGFTGSIGFTGSSGNGYTGSSGAFAAVGYTGSAGFVGSNGYVGSSGNGFIGSSGYVGSVGFSGSLGFTGSVGAGYTGSVGYIGSIGFSGSIGFTGSVGAGYTGSAGFNGSLGYTGSQGDLGYTGSRGAAGFTGSLGYTGSVGIGYAGSRGLLGYTGSQGPVGTGLSTMPDGTAAAPGFPFTNETTTGFYRPGTGQMGISILGTQEVTISNTSTTINTNLLVNGNGTFSSGTGTITSLSLTTNTTGAFVGTSSQHNLALGSNSIKKIHVLPGGNTVFVTGEIAAHTGGGAAEIIDAGNYSSTVPVYAFYQNSFTGMGNPAANNLSFIVQGVQTANVFSAGGLYGLNVGNITGTLTPGNSSSNNLPGIGLATTGVGGDAVMHISGGGGVAGAPYALNVNRRSGTGAIQRWSNGGNQVATLDSTGSLSLTGSASANSFAATAGITAASLSLTGQVSAASLSLTGNAFALSLNLVDAVGQEVGRVRAKSVVVDTNQYIFLAANGLAYMTYDGTNIKANPNLITDGQMAATGGFYTSANLRADAIALVGGGAGNTYNYGCTGNSVQLAPGQSASVFSKNMTGETNQIVFNNPYGQVGFINTNYLSTSYGTSSDYRLKRDVQPLTGALATIAALKPSMYKWIPTGTEGEGFIAHELQVIIPHAVSGRKDEVNEDGSIKPQGVDYSKIVVHLVAAMQEQQAQIDRLREKDAGLQTAITALQELVQTQQQALTQLQAQVAALTAQQP
jgi:hypothetical protein